MKLDKETFAKHNFWFLLLFAVPLALLAIVLLMTVVPGQINAERKKLDDMVKDGKNTDLTQYKSASEIALKKKEADIKEAEKKKIWAKAYNQQEPIFGWMESLDERFRNGLFALKIKAVEKPTGTFPENTENKFHGILKEDARSDSILVEGAKGETKLFYKTEHTLKVDLGSAKTFFQFLKKGYQVEVTYEKGKFFGDAFTKEEQDLYVDGYEDQIYPIIDLVQPVNAEGKGAVILRNWPVPPNEKALPPANATFFHYVTKEWIPGKFDEVDIWCAQENLWIQREIYRIIAEANRQISVFKNIKNDPKNQEFYFENAYWAVKINKKSDTKLDFYLANRMNRWQRLGVEFDIITDYKDKNREEPVVQTIVFKGSLVPPFDGKNNQNPNEYDYQKQTITLEKPAKGIYGVEQHLSWKLAAVKRIDQIAIGAHSHRTASEKLVSFESKNEKKPGADPNSPLGGFPGVDAPDGGVGPPGGVMPPGGGADENDGLGGVEGDKKLKDKYTRMGLLKKRYLKVSDQSRRVPIGVSLIVDQRHIDLVATAFRNSKLRFLTTQVMMHQYPYELSPTIAANPLPNNMGNDPNMIFDPNRHQPGVFPPGVVPPGGMPPGVVPPGAFPGQNEPDGGALPGQNQPEFPEENNEGVNNDFGMPGFNQPGMRPGRNYSFSDEQDPNLELVIYGVISLYQRYPPRDESLLPPPPADEQQQQQPVAPAFPGGV